MVSLNCADGVGCRSATGGRAGGCAAIHARSGIYYGSKHILFSTWVSATLNS
jgi:hypothetical protein